MRQNYEIEGGEINTLCLYVGRKDIAIIAGIEQDSLTATSTRAEKPQSFVIAASLPKAS
jgi:hypothetical protein